MRFGLVEHFFRIIGFDRRFLVQHARHPGLVELAAPAADDDGRDAVADEVGERPRFLHEPIHTQDERDAGNWNGADRGECRSQHD